MNQQNDHDISFMSQMEDVVPIAKVNKVAVANNHSETLSQRLKREALEKQIALDDNGLSIDSVTPLDPYAFLSYKKDGVQEGVFKNLRLGKYQIDSRLSLRGVKFDDARLSLFDTITDCHERGIRTLLVDHGMGLQSKPFAGFMKSYVNRWLSEIEAVIAYHTALKQHGGLASVYVLLKKHPNQKQINREVHQKRS
ncbi:Smr domain (Small MutS Related) containing protein [Glaciecola punicea ACAM 611]|jgi:DNA-nicking Smr family endonuclease|uniref:Smr domain (Small MutS Related) containing protein n=1 Tax=Glaciecola punicea ACAM 611 TaxID=1121923 RepID=H5TB89_9ALTE|nr:DNA endonuclease SmrA [Glaciecola punicea]GAB55566.1 Smr domain (Small MutS Related) containing protein [Glaciecola punicea ACAM 611]